MLIGKGEAVKILNGLAARQSVQAQIRLAALSRLYELELIGEGLSSDSLGFIFPLGSDLVGPINEALAAMKADGSLAEISGRYFGDSFTITYDDLTFPEYDEEG